MRSTIVAGIAAVLALASAPAAAQTPLSGPALQVTPYLGYLVSTPIIDGPFGSSVSTTSSGIYGAQLGVRMAPSISLIGNFAYSTGNVEVGVPIFGGVEVGRSTMLFYDGGLELQLGKLRTSALELSPFFQFGAGAIRYEAKASVLEASATNFAGNAGLGADMEIVPGIGMRLLVKDYFGKFDFKEATSLDVTGSTTHNWALSAGVRLDF